MSIHVHIHDSGAAPSAGMGNGSGSGIATTVPQTGMPGAMPAAMAAGEPQAHSHADATDAGGPPQALVAQIEAALGARQATAGMGQQGDMSGGAAPG